MALTCPELCCTGLNSGQLVNGAYLLGYPAVRVFEPSREQILNRSIATSRLAPCSPLASPPRVARHRFAIKGRPAPARDAVLEASAPKECRFSASPKEWQWGYAGMA